MCWRGGTLLKESVAHVAVLAFVCLDDVGSQCRDVGEYESVPYRCEQPARREMPEDAMP